MDEDHCDEGKLCEDHNLMSYEQEFAVTPILLVVTIILLREDEKQTKFGPFDC